MGPYCNFCGGRCFQLASVTLGCVDSKRAMLWDLVVRLSARPPELLATCEKGKAFDKTKIGVSHDDLLVLRDAYERGMKDAQYPANPTAD